MTFEAIVDQAIEMIQRRGQLSSRMLKRQFDLDDTSLDDLTYELIEIHQIAVDQDGKMLVWTGDTEPEAAVSPTSGPTSAATAQESPPISYTPQYLTEFPVIDLLKRYVHIEDSDDARTIRAKVTGQILTLDESLQDTIPTLLSLLDALPENSPFLKLDPLQRRQRTLDGLKRILLRESQVQPLVLVFEDLHWHDNESQALLDSLVESLPTAHLLLLVNYRPEYTHGWGGKTYYTQLRLDPLPPESADALLDALLGDDASLESLKMLLIERTEGNPFFLEESVRTLVETQILAGEPGAYRLVRDLPTIQVPATVQAVLAARIDRLHQEEKQLLQTASVIENEVPFTLLQAIAEIPEDTLYRGLTHLQATEFLYETSLFPERVYVLARRALDLSLAHKERGHEAWSLRLLGNVATHRDPSEFNQAETYYHQALTLANELGMRPLQAHCHRSLGKLYSQAGQAEQAHAELSTAIEMYREMEMMFRLPETEAALAAVEGW